MITADLCALIDKTFEFETQGHKKQTHVLVGEEDPYGHIRLLVEVIEENGEMHRDWIDYEFFLTYIDRAVA